MRPLHCPHDGAALVRTKLAPGAIVSACPSCAGRAVAIGVVRRQVPAAVARDLWQRARAEGTRPIDATPCPSCMRVMARAPLGLGDDEPFDVDLCQACHLVWFDPGEAEALPPPVERDDGEALAPWSGGSGQAPGPGRRRHAARPLVFEDFLPANRARSDSIGPWLLAIVVAVNGVIGLCSDTWFDAWACWLDDGRYGTYWPGRRISHFVFDFLWSLLMHANVWHLLANVVFLVAYGRAAVHRDGEGTWLGVVLGGALLGGVAQKLAVLSTAGPGGPIVGLSAGTSALVVWIAVSAPHARIGVPYRAAGRWRELTWPALGGAVAWIAVHMALLDGGLAPTAGLAAIGLAAGAAAGAVAAFLRPCG